MFANVSDRVPWLGFGLLVGIAAVGVRAFAEEPPTVVEAPRPVEKCRLFSLAEMEKDRELNTDDRTTDRKSTRLNSSHSRRSRMPSSA